MTKQIKLNTYGPVVLVASLFIAVFLSAPVSAAGGYNTPSSNAIESGAAGSADQAEDDDSEEGVVNGGAAATQAEDEENSEATSTENATNKAWLPVLLGFAGLAAAYYFLLYRNGQSLTEYIEKRYKKDN